MDNVTHESQLAVSVRAILFCFCLVEVGGVRGRKGFSVRFRIGFLFLFAPLLLDLEELILVQLKCTCWKMWEPDGDVKTGESHPREKNC